VATAWSVDGLVEAMEDSRPDRFVVAVQWHPELGWEKDLFSQKLFKRFVNQASIVMPAQADSDLASVSG
jgi:putative glutamine amidotransferase